MGSAHTEACTYIEIYVPIRVVFIDSTAFGLKQIQKRGKNGTERQWRARQGRGVGGREGIKETNKKERRKTIQIKSNKKIKINK